METWWRAAALLQHSTTHHMRSRSSSLSMYVMSASEWAERRLELGAGGEGGSQADGHCILQ